MGGEWLRRHGWGASGTRRVVHGSVGLFVAGSPWLFSGPGPLCVLAAGFVILNGAARICGWWPSVHAARPTSWGTVALPLAVLPAVAATWGVFPGRVVAFQGAFLVVAIADPLAAWVGERSDGPHLTETATWPGTGAFVAATTVLVGGSLYGGGWGPSRALAVAGVTGIVAATVEAISRRGWDNLFVVLAVVAILVPLIEGRSDVPSMGVALLAGFCFGGAAFWGGALTRTGALGGGLFAAALVALGGVRWVVPGLAFFVLSSALSALPHSREGGEGGRQLRQVLANGGVAWGLLLVFAVVPVDAEGLRAGCYAGFLGALAAAAADTWASELGTRYGGPPRSVIGGGRVPPGTSGAVSLVGTGAAALGAASVALAAAIVAPGGESAQVHLWRGAVAGVVGMAVDSLAGATIERPSRSPASDPVHRRREDGWTEDDWKWGLDNEGVNFLCTAAGALAAIGLWGL